MNNELLFTLGVLARYYVILVLCAGAIGKLTEFSKFSNGLVESLGWPENAVRTLGMALIFIEAGAAVFLSFQSYFYEYALFTSMGLFFVFFLFITAITLKNKVVTCNCFGKGEQKLSLLDSFRNVLLICATLVLYFVDIVSKIHFNFNSLFHLLLLVCAFNLVIVTVYIKEIILIFKFNHEDLYYG